MTSGLVLVFGRSGQLAQELAELETPETPVICVGRERCDLLTTDPGPLIEELSPALVINAAAFSLVDLAESERDAAFVLNRDAPGRMARACAKRRIPFVHVSTDYVFDGDKGAPYVEEDERAPLGVYGASKAAGEDAVQEAGGSSAIIRVAWLYSVFGANFPKTILRVAANREEIDVVGDQHGRPTPAGLVATGAIALGSGMQSGREEASGVFHLSTRGDATWAEFAEEVLTRCGSATAVRRITTSEYPTRARRPADSRLDPAKLEAVLGLRFPDWRTPLDDFAARLPT